MRITEEQLALLSGLKCERLSSDENNLNLVSAFSNPKIDSLTEKLQGDAFEEDENGEVAYYLIKDKSDRILFYFSLKCGQMFDRLKLFEEDKYTKFIILKLDEIIHDPKVAEEYKMYFVNELNNLANRKGISKRELDDILRDGKQNIYLNNSYQPAEGVKKVGNTFSSVEIVHFCKNAIQSPLWTREQIPHKLGVVVFWTFIVPIIQEIKRFVGCQYLYLFAADFDPDESLVNYYTHILDFNSSEDYKTAIPDYDLGCRLLWQDTKDLQERCDYFFDNFNLEN